MKFILNIIKKPLSVAAIVTILTFLVLTFVLHQNKNLDKKDQRKKTIKNIVISILGGVAAWMVSGILFKKSGPSIDSLSSTSPYSSEPDAIPKTYRLVKKGGGLSSSTNILTDLWK